MVHQAENQGPLLPQFYAGRSLLITGATGFMGKVLVERILSTCPDVGCLHLLMRGKRGVSPETRLQQLIQSPAFDKLRARSPHQLEKLRALPGDVTETHLGISPASLTNLQEVSVVFHSAATVKLDEELKQAVDQNLRSVLSMLDICDSLPKLEVFIYVSTAYSNAERSFVEERVYPPRVSLHDLLEFIDSSSREVVEATTSEYIFPKPNTYTFTKAMAEHAVDQHRDRNYAVAIFRPSTVVSALRHPVLGWIESYSGPGGMIAAMGTGLMRVMRGRGDLRGDFLPVDVTIDALLAVGWETGVDKSSACRVYNCTSMNEHHPTWDEFAAIVSRRLSRTDAFWPQLILVENRYLHKALRLLMQTVPHHLIHAVSPLIGARKDLLKLSQKINKLDDSLHYFVLREWRFCGDNMRRLRERLSPADRQIYNLDSNNIDWNENLQSFVDGVVKHLLKKDLDRKDSGRTVRSKI